MKKKVLIAMLAAVMVSAAVLAGCGSSEPVQPESSSAAVSEASQPADPASSEAESSTAETPSAISGDFEKKFDENPLDADFEAQMESASTTQEIFSVANTYGGLWSSEVAYAYSQLLNAPGANVSEIEADQKKWNDNLSAELARIQQSVEGDGSTVRTEQAIRIKDFYREKAKSLYAQLYQLNPDYTYDYTPY